MKDRPLLIGTAVWAIATLLFLVFHADLSEWLWILISGVWLAWAAFAILLFVCSVIKIRRNRRPGSACAITVVGLVIFTLTVGQQWGERIRFALVRHSYEQRLQEILRSYEQGRPMESRRAEYQIESGPPIRVAFMWQAGVTDNWVGLVYDPTGIVMKANQFKPDWSNWNDPALEPVKRLFGGDIIETRHLGEHWYICVFT